MKKVQPFIGIAHEQIEGAKNNCMEFHLDLWRILIDQFFSIGFLGNLDLAASVPT